MIYVNKLGSDEEIMIKWLFFDLGSTLIDETECKNYRISETLKQVNAPSKALFLKRMEENTIHNRQPYKDTVIDFGLEIVKWPKHLERLYPEVPQILIILREKYKLGIIANQSLGTEERLVKYGIRDYFDIVLASAEEGIAKPDVRIFEMALQRANCLPQEACMIGDRLDNDVVPAAKLGMYTIWVRQGDFAKQDSEKIEYKPDLILKNIVELLNVEMLEEISNEA